MRVRDLMTKQADVITIGPGAAVSDAVSLLMEHGVGALPVMASDGSPVGIVAERDIVAALHATGDEVLTLPVKRVMRRPAPMCEADDPLRDVMARMTVERTRHLVVCEGGRIAGVISVGDLVKHRLEQLETEAGVLRDYVAAQRARV